MANEKMLRLLSVFHLFRCCQEVSFKEITDLMPVSKKTIYRDISLLKQAGVLRTRYDHRLNAFLPLGILDVPPDFPENKTQKKYMEKLIRLCTVMHEIMGGEEDPHGWYRDRFPHVSDRTRQRDFALLNQLGFEIYYEPAWYDEPGHWVCNKPDTYSLTTFTEMRYF